MKKLSGMSVCRSITSRIMACVMAICFMAALGCGSAVKYTLSPDYNERMPNTVAVMPVGGTLGNADVKYLFRTLAYEKLIQKGYFPIPLEITDDRLLRSVKGRDEFYTRSPQELAEIIGAESVLYITVTEWDTTLVLTYASIDIGAKIELFDGAGGGKLWKSEYYAEDSDMRFDRDVAEMGVVKMYEPAVQRVIDAIFSILPRYEGSKNTKTRKSYYNWLP